MSQNVFLVVNGAQVSDNSGDGFNLLIAKSPVPPPGSIAMQWESWNVPVQDPGNNASIGALCPQFTPLDPETGVQLVVGAVSVHSGQTVYGLDGEFDVVSTAHVLPKTEGLDPVKFSFIYFLNQVYFGYRDSSDQTFISTYDSNGTAHTLPLQTSKGPMLSGHGVSLLDLSDDRNVVWAVWIDKTETLNIAWCSSSDFDKWASSNYTFNLVWNSAPFPFPAAYNPDYQFNKLPYLLYDPSGYIVMLGNNNVNAGTCVSTTISDNGIPTLREDGTVSLVQIFTYGGGSESNQVALLNGDHLLCFACGNYGAGGRLSLAGLPVEWYKTMNSNDELSARPSLKEFEWVPMKGTFVDGTIWDCSLHLGDQGFIGMVAIASNRLAATKGKK